MNEADARQDAGRSETEFSRIETELALGEDAREAEPDEGKFARLGADFVLRKHRATSSMQTPLPAEYSNADRDECKFVNFSEGVLARKGEARPSSIAPRSGEFGGAATCNGWDTPAGGMPAVRQAEASLLQARNSQPSPEEVQVQACVAAPGKRWHEEAEAALAKAEAAWKAEEAARLSAAKAQWQENSTKALAQARAEAEAAQDQSTELELNRLRQELAAMQAALVDHEMTLARECVAIERERESWQREAQEALSKVEADWKAEEAARLSAAKAQWQENSTKALAQARAEAEAARDRGTELELNRLRRELAAMQAALVDHETALARECVVIERERESWQRDAQEALSKAERNWKAEEAARFAAAKAQWQENSTKALAQARAEAEAARDRGTELELNRLRRELAAMQAALVDHETTLARECVAIERERESRQREVQGALSKAQAAWKAEEAARFAAAKAQWQENSTKALALALAQARAETEAAHDQGTELELDRLRRELAAMQAALVDHEMALARECVAIERERESWQREAQETQSKAEAAWKAEEAERFAAAKAQWQENSTKALALAQARAETEAARDQGTELELNRLRRELAAMQATLVDHETALARECVAIERERESRQREVQGALSKAEAVWKAEEAERFAAAKAQWRMQSSSAMAEAAARLATAQAELADREISLARANLTIEQSQDFTTPQAEIVLKPDRIGIARVAPERPTETQAWRHPIRDLFLVASLAASAIVFYPGATHFLPEFGTLFSAPAPVTPPKPVSPQITEQSLAVVTQAANVRAAPSPDAAIISTLQRGVKVAAVEQRGNWTLVRIDRDSGKAGPRQGWVHNSSLNGAGSSEKRPSTATRD